MFINGIEVVSGSGNETGTYTGMPNTNNDLYMGADQTSPTTTDINGDFNRQYFWKNRELNDAEMLLMSNRLLSGVDIL